MWAIGFIGDYNPMGNDGAMKLHYKSIKGILQETSVMRKINTSVYIMREYSQKMCEMSNYELYKYCTTHYIMSLPCGNKGA